MSRAGKRVQPLLLIVVNDAAFFRTHRWPLALAAREAGWQVEVASAPGVALDWIRSQGIPVHPVPFRRKGVHLLKELATLLALWKLYRRLRPDLVHHVTIKPILYGGIAARFMKLPAVVHAVTGLGFIFSKQGKAARLAQGMAKMAYRLALDYRRAATIFQNPDDLREIWGLSDHPRSVIIPGAGVDPEEFIFVEEPPGEPLVVLASRMLWSKGVAEFVEAARRCRADGIRCRFALVGDSDPGNPEGVSTETLRRWRDEGVVEWWGRREDMPEVFRQAHVVTLPTTYREGVPKVLIEAAAAGRPLIATDMPGCREIVHHGDNGLLVPPRDPVALASAIKMLVNDPELRKRMGTRGRERVLRQFSLDHVLRQTLTLYRRIIAPQPFNVIQLSPAKPVD